MIKRLSAAALLIGLIVFTGCIDATTVVAVKKDGSGYVVETVCMGESMGQMMNMMGFDPEGEASSAAPSISAEDIAQARDKAATMGTGVRFVSIDPVERANGSQGTRTVFAFDDVRTLKVSSDPGASGDAMGAPEADPNPIRFEFAGGRRPKLTVVMPPQESGAGAMAESPEMAMPAGAVEAPPEAMAQMMQMFEGFRVRLVVKVDGEITESNASHIGRGAKDGKRQFVTLMDMDFDALMKAPDALAKMMAMGQPQDLDAAAAAFKDVPGLKVETAPRVEIAFR